MGLSLQWGFRPPHCADLSVSTPPPLAGIQLWPFRLCVHRNRSVIRWFYPFVSHFLSKTRLDLRFLRSGGLLSSERAVLKLFTHRFRREENPPNTMKCFWATVAHVSATGPPAGFRNVASAIGASSSLAKALLGGRPEAPSHVPRALEGEGGAGAA